MNQFNNPVGMQAQTDLGLKKFMLGTYRYMAMAMAVTAAIAFFAGQYFIANPQAFAVIQSPFVLLGFVFAIPLLFGAVGRKLPTMSQGGMLTFLFGFAAFLGIFVSAIGMFYNPMIIAKVFFMTVALFAGLSLFGYTTGRNLGTFAKYAGIAFLAYVGISLLGAFIPDLRPTGPLDTIITIVALLAISVMVAWETQFLKQTYYGSASNPAMMDKLSIFGAASLLLSFVNMFQLLLSLIGRE